MKHQPLVRTIFLLLLVTCPAKGATPMVLEQKQAADEVNRADGAQQAELSQQEKARRKTLISVSWVLLTGVILLGAVAVLFAIIWGARTRRIARTSPPDAKLKQEFWYLKEPANRGGEQETESQPDAGDEA